MIRRLNIYVFYMRLVCNLLPLAAFAVAEYVRFLGPHQFETFDYDPRAYFQLLIFATVVWSISADHYGLASPDTLLLASSGLQRTFSTCCATYAVLFVTLFFYREVSFSRVFLATSAVMLLLAGIAFQSGCRRLAKKALARNATRLLIVGADAYAGEIAARLRSASLACQVVGYVRMSGQEIGVAGSKVCHLGETGEFALGNSIDEIVIAVSPARWSELPTIIPALERLGVPMRAVLDVGQGVITRDQLFHFGSLNLLDLGATPLDSVSYLLFKRVMDMFVSVAALIVAAPLLLVIAAAIRLTSPGPVLFAQDRVGLNGKVFRMYKFRTMRVMSLAESETSWTTQNDCRRTRLGAFLRRHSLDELPQLFNVLRGDMSLVGPRPERPHFVRKFLRELAPYNSRHRLKVGMTGWAQVNGLRGDTSIAQRTEYDLYYLRNWSLAFDLRIMAMTVWTELFGDNGC